MPTINQLASLSQVSGGDQLPIYVPNNGDARKVSVSQLLAYFQTVFAAPTVSTTLYTPGAGFNITVPTPVSEQQWMLIQPAGTLATGTVTLPLNTGVPDGTQVLITSTQTITAFTIALNGAAAIFGDVSTITAGNAVQYRYYLATNSWYNITNEASATVQALSGPGAVDITSLATSFTSTAAGNALTLADGAQGQLKTVVYIAEAAGGDTGILTPANLGSATTITFNAVGDSATLQFIGTDWWVVGFRGAVVA
jgi:hypothetical protein